MADPEQDAWWRDTERLAIVTIAVAFVLLLGLAVIAAALDTGEFFGFPPGYFLAALILPILLAVVVFWFCRRQAAVDRRHGLPGD